MNRTNELRELYQARADASGKQAQALEAKGHRLGNLRGVSFAVFVVSGLLAWSNHSSPALWLSGAGLVAFLFLIPKHDRVLAREEDARRRALLNEHALARVSGKWHDLPRTGEQFRPPGHPYAADLDLVGPASLYQRISVAHTRYGQRTLAQWLMSPATEEDIRGRAAAVQEFADLLDLRQDFEAEGMALVEKRRGTTKVITDGPDPAPLLAWARQTDALPLGIPGRILSYLLPVTTIAGFLLQAFRGAHPAAWAIPLALGLILMGASRHATSRAFAAVSTTEGAFLRYGALLALLEKLPAQAPYVQARVARLSARGGEGKKERPPSVVMNDFKRLVGWFDLRHNGMAYPFVNGLLLWDLHCTRALHHWRLRVGENLDEWFQIIGEMEALYSLAGLLHDDPQMRIPEVRSESEDVVISATGLGHPLISPDARVRNDLVDLHGGEALLITGSNMSGKSTFLRALGINAVLAFAGGPVCAEAFRLPLCQLGTSIRIEDSLAAGVSHFYAEVKRLADIVAAIQNGRPTLFLLDEVLHGTNSRERQIGARWILAELLKHGAFGIITTHDMELCRLPDALMTRVRQHHFREDVAPTADLGEPKMTFDYTLREGPVTSGNALRLMRRVGLEVPLTDEA